MWIKVNDRKFPILSLLDQATKFQAAGVLHGERAEHLISVMERHWARHFDCPRTLLTDGAGLLMNFKTEQLNYSSRVFTNPVATCQLLRAAPHHVRPNFVDLQVGIDGLQAARHAIAGLKSRGVTRFLDLGRLNRRNIDDVEDDEEGMQDDAPGDDGEDDGGDELPSVHRRIDDHPGLDLDLHPDYPTGMDSMPVPPKEPADLDLQSDRGRSVSYAPSLAPDDVVAPSGGRPDS
eukprot:s1436_g16.t1